MYQLWVHGNISETYLFELLIPLMNNFKFIYYLWLLMKAVLIVFSAEQPCNARVQMSMAT